jgi:hypothetical protein
MGWNQWVKCVAPFSMAQFFIAMATALATSISRRCPRAMVFLSTRYTSLESLDRITESLNTRLPNMAGTSATAHHSRSRI